MVTTICKYMLSFEKIQPIWQDVIAIKSEGSLNKRSAFPSFFFRDETRRDWKPLPELAVPGQDNYFLVPLLEKIRVKFETGRDYSAPLGKFLNGLGMN